MAVKTLLKDPSAILDYTFDWSDWLRSGDTISTSSWTVTSGMTKVTDTATTTTATIWVSGGTAGITYTAKNTIVTAAGRTDSRSLYLKVEER